MDYQLDRFYAELHNDHEYPFRTTHLKIPHHQINPDRIGKLARALSHKNLEAPIVSLGSINTNNDFLHQLSMKLEKYEKNNFFKSLIQLELTPNVLIVTEDSCNAILRLLRKNPLLVDITCRPRFVIPEHFTQYINKELDGNRQRFKNLVENLIEKGDFITLKKICEKPLLRKILQGYAKELHEFAAKKSEHARRFIETNIPVAVGTSIPILSGTSQMLAQGRGFLAPPGINLTPSKKQEIKTFTTFKR